MCKKMKTYKMTIAGLERELPIFSIGDKISIAAFIMFGDAELTVAAAAELLKKVPEFDYILTPEAKSIPLAHEMSRQSGKKYFVTFNHKAIDAHTGQLIGENIIKEMALENKKTNNYAWKCQYILKD